MGAWGHRVFENDGAMDFAGSVVDGGGIGAIEEIFDRVLGVGGDYLESSDAEEALMAAEIVARIKGKPGAQATYFNDVDGWIAKARPSVSAVLADKAKRVVTRIQGENSEMVELWQESDEFEAWKAEVSGLLTRLC